MTGKKQTKKVGSDVLSSDEDEQDKQQTDKKSGKGGKGGKSKEGMMDRYAESAGVDTSSIQLVEVSIFESYTMLLSAIGALEFGFAYTTIFCMIIMTVAFSEMVKLQRMHQNEVKIVINSKIIEWYFFACFQLLLIPKTWLTLPILQKSGLAPEPGSFIHAFCYEYHSLAVFMLLTFGVILFVVSLQEGFYSYQFRMLGWTLLCAILIISGCQGLLLALWKCRIWFFYTVSCVTVHNAIDYLTCHFFPLRTPMLILKPEATFEGFTAGAISCFLFFSIVVTYLIDLPWFMQVANRITFLPFDNTSHSLAQGPLYEKNLQTISWVTSLGMEPITFVASELQLHLFVITVFIAFIAPFGGFLFAGLKRAMRQSHLSISIFKGGVIDRLDCIIITGCFVLIYMNMLVIRNEVPEVSAVLDMVADLSEKAQIELYNKLKLDLLSTTAVN